ncbi:hypothetical protein BGZ51_000581, partial [Haplosporangium sp. Z 767]
MTLDRTQVSANAELLFKGCMEKAINTKTVPAPAEASAQASAQPTPVEPVTILAQSESPAPSDIKANIDVATDVDSKLVYTSGFKDSSGAKTILPLRVNLESEF